MFTKIPVKELGTSQRMWAWLLAMLHRLQQGHLLDAVPVKASNKGRKQGSEAGPGSDGLAMAASCMSVRSELDAHNMRPDDDVCSEWIAIGLVNHQAWEESKSELTDGQS